MGYNSTLARWVTCRTRCTTREAFVVDMFSFWKANSDDNNNNATTEQGGDSIVSPPSNQERSTGATLNIAGTEHIDQLTSGVASPPRATNTQRAPVDVSN